MAILLSRNLLLAAAVTFSLPCAAASSSFTTLYSFTGGVDGAGPRGLLYHRGALYGITHHLGSTACYGDGCGTMFEIDPTTGAETRLYTFQGAPLDGAYDTSGLMSSGGILYGTTSTGGKWNLGTVYTFDPITRAETVIYSFRGAPRDGANPAGTLIVHEGAVYGTTMSGGSKCAFPGCGTVFKINIQSGAEKIVYAFAGGFDGAAPAAGLIYHAGAFYGTTQGGDVASDFGTAFKIHFSPAGALETVLHSFTGGPDGAFPDANLLYRAGALYGTTQGGDTVTDHGTVFKLAIDRAPSAETVLHRFQSGRDGALPEAGLSHIDGLLYGTTVLGGNATVDGDGYGTIYSVDMATGAETVLHRFSDERGGRYPEAQLLLQDGKIFGTTFFGGVGCHGVGCGTVFAFSP